ncbi:hybrid sensor histidine kinase/response regulator transcription factor [Paenibacillus sp. J2TS4]|uniref:helix-turn-helix transcriptional regulator n=1 Tax=Paenibacillus sp. J2TS4 TaxID=2807194 RepID=UPI001B176137|nr:hybrid sensor histidine kinase/response regulator transcription factor [Paenibacillus sp. J2TS4]GIP33821.1 histidine kinase [Paenibacillus sp. J2TS4]
MPGLNSRWLRPDWLILTFRTLWFLFVVLYLSFYRAELQFISLWSVLGCTFICYTIPLLLLRIHYRWYLAAEFVLCGLLSLYLTYNFHQMTWFFAAAFVIAFYSRDKSYLWTGALAVVAVPILESWVTGSSLQDIMSRGVNYALIYILGFTIQKLIYSLQTIKEKLGIIHEQYQILEQYSNQVQRITLLEERNRMARELHDTIGHTFTSMILGMEAIRQYIPQEEGQTRLNKLLQLSRQGLEDIRTHVHEMDPLEENEPLEHSLFTMAEEFKENTGVKVAFRTIGEPYPVMKQAKLTLYRSLQESLTNAIRHGNATSVQIHLQYEPGQLTLQIQDNGKGDDELQYGFGLSNTRERLAALQGKLQIYSKANEGTLVICRLPVETDPTDRIIKILVVDDQSLIRDSLSLLLGEEQDFEVDVAESGRQAIDKCGQEAFDIVLMDVHMPETDGIAATKAIKEQSPEVRIIMITTFGEVGYAAEALRIGAEGYLLKSVHPKELKATIRLVNSGGTMISQDIANRLFTKPEEAEPLKEGDPAAPNPYGLTEREQEILLCMTKGLRYKAIALQLHLSEGTVRNYISFIYSKLQVGNRDEAVAKALHEKLVP